MFRIKQILILLVPSLLLIACNQEQHTESENPTLSGAETSTEKPFVISGVSSKGPIRGATVNVFAMTANGAKSGNPLGTATTDNNGLWSVSITPAPTQILLVESSGGSYIDEADPAQNKRKIDLDPTTGIIEGVLFPAQSTASITLITDALLEKSRNESTTNSINIQTVLTNNRNIAINGLGFDPFHTRAADPLAPSSQSNDSIEYAMYLGGLATALNSAAIQLNKPVPDYAMMMALVTDLSDGRLNGLNGSDTIPVLIDTVSQDFPNTLNLNRAILRFRNNNYQAYASTAVSTPVVVNETVMAQPGINQFPVAVNDSISTTTGTAVTISTVLNNDSDADGDSLTTSIGSQPSSGNVSSPSNGVFIYTPSASFNGTDSFTYQVNDGNGGIDSARVTITVQPASGGGGGTSAPTSLDGLAGADISVDEQTTVNLSADDPDGRFVSFSWSKVSGADVTLNGTDTAAPSFTAPTVLLGNLEILLFEVVATESNGNSSRDFVQVTVNPVTSPPTANAGPDQTVNEQTLVTLNGSGSSDDIAINTYVWNQLSPVSPVATLSDAAAISPTFTGPDVANDTVFTFELTVTDNEGGTATDTVAITLVSDNVGPTGVDDIASTPEDTPVTITNLLANDTDVSGNNTPFIITGVTQPTNGSAVIEANGTDVTYTPPLNFNGVDTFTYTSQDSLGADSVNAATVTITVSGVNDNPTANPDTASTIQGFPVTIPDPNATPSIPSLIANDTDPENDPLSISGIASQPANGVVINNNDGTVTYTPNLAFSGVDSFTYSVVDGTGGSATGTVTITVVPDTDGDGIIDADEGPGGTGTDPALADTDGDGFFDGHEILVGTNAIDGINVFPPTTVISAGTGNNIISVDTTWALAQSPFWLQSDVSIQSGATLTIEPGVVIKSDSNVDFLVNNGGALVAQGNAATPQHVVFTSSFDDSINGDTTGDGGATPPSNNDWNGIDFQSGSINGVLRNAAVKYGTDCIDISNSSPIIDNTEIGDCGSIGIDIGITNNATHGVNLSNITVIDYDGNGISTLNDGFQITSASGATANLDIRNVTISDSGNNTSFDFGIEILASGGNINGIIDNVSVINPSSDGINIVNSSSGDVNIALSNLSVTGSGANSLDVRDTSTASGQLNLTFDGVNSFINNLTTATAVYFENNDPDFVVSGSTSIDNAGYGLQLNNSAGSFRNITMDNTAIAGVRLENASNPLVFSDISLTNADTPYELVGQDLTPTITAGYDFTDPSVSKSYIRVLGTFPANMTLTPDPLNTGGAGAASVWRVPDNITIPAGVTLTINDGAIVKFDLNRIVFVNGSLVIGDGITGGAQAILTSTRDETVGADADPADTTPPAAGNWNYLQLNNGSSINIDNAIIRYMSRGIFQSFSDITSFTITNTEFREFSTYGLDITTTGSDTFTLNTVTVANQNPSTNNSDGIRIANSGTRTITVDFDNVTVDTVGNDVNNDRGIEFFLDSNSLLTGRLDNITVSNTFGTGIILQNSTAGLVDPVFSGMNITNPGSGRYGLQLIGNSDGFTRPTLDASTANNLIGDASPGSGGFYGVLVQGVNGSYSNITISNTTSSALFISGTTNPLSWDDASIILNSSPSPWTIRTTFPASIGVLGSADLGYTPGTGLIQSYVQVNNTLVDTILVADPLNTASAGPPAIPASVWRVDTDITIPAGVTLTINDGAIVKFDLGRIVFVNGNLVIGDGVAGGAQAILTSTRDESIGADADPTDTAAPAAGNWNYLQLNNGSSINIDNAIIRYMNRGIFQSFSDIGAFSISNTEFREFSTFGLDITTAGSDTFALNTVTVANQIPSTNNSDGIRIANSGTRIITVDFDNVTVDTVGNDVNNDRGIEFFLDSNSLLTGRLDNTTVSNTIGTAILLQNTTAGLVDPVFSGLNITNPGASRYGLQLIGNDDGFTQPTVDDSFNPGSVTNFIGDPLVADTGGVYGMLLQGVNGVYNNITISNTVSSTPVNNPKSSALFISGVTNPTVWDDASIILNNSASPWTIRTAFPPSIGVLGTADLGYTAGTGLIQNYVQMNSTVSDMTLVADPLNTGGAGPASVWRVDTDVTIPAGVSLTINDGAIVKFDLNRIVFVNGNLVIGDGLAGGAQAILTSSRDETVGSDADPADATAPAAGNWNYLQLNNGSSINIDNAIIRYMSRGILQSFTDIVSFSISNTEIREFNTYGLDIVTTGNDTFTLNTVTVANQLPSTNNQDGIRIANSGTRTITVDFDNVTVDTVGNDAGNDRGIEFFINASGLLTGRLDNITVSNTFGSGIIMQNDSNGLVNPVFSGLNISNVGVHGIQLIGLGAGNTTPTIDGSTGPNIIGDAQTAGSGGDLGLTFQGVNGSYSDITVNSTNDSALYFSNDANPTFGLNVILDNSPSPYTLIGMNLPVGVAYTSGTFLVEEYARLAGTLTGSMTLAAEPLGIGSFWRVPTTVTVPSATTLTIDPGALLKFETFAELVINSGATLNINGTSGNHVIMTSSTDDNVGVGNSALLIDWEGVRFAAGSAGGTINFLDIWYARDGIDFSNVTTNPLFNDLSVNYCQDGLRINSSTGMTLRFNNLSMNENSSSHIVLEGSGSLSTTFTEDAVNGLTINDIPGNGADAINGIFISNTDSTNVVSGFTITGTANPIRYSGSGANILDGNIIRQSTQNGISHTSNGNPIIRNNIIVNNAQAGIQVSSGNGNIFGNLIRQNTRFSGGGINLTSSSVTVENNLIVENRSTSNTSNSGGSGIYITGNSSPIIINNTIANNTSADNGGFEGAGLNVETSGGAITLRDNIIFGNVDNVGANDVYDDVGRITVANNNFIGTINSNGGLNLFTGGSDIVGSDPLFVQGWYLSAADIQGPQSPAIDAGSNNAASILPFALNTLSTRTDGGLDGTADGAIVNIGYHYPTANVAANPAISQVTSVPTSPVNTVAGAPVVITITPQDGVSNILGAGLIVEAELASNAGNPSTGTATTTGTNSTMSTVADLGDGTYRVTFTPSSGFAGSETITIFVNGVQLDTTISVIWTAI